MGVILQLFYIYCHPQMKLILLVNFYIIIIVLTYTLKF
nr:MAG TPA: hypothetical protein [Caudoviricetes sp.]